MTDTETTAESLSRNACEAYEAIRAINHKTNGPIAIPAPLVYDVLGNGYSLAYALQQALQQIGVGLVRSLEEYSVREDDGSDPIHNVMAAQELMVEAAKHAGHIGRLLQDAQNAISGQGYGPR